MSDDKQIQAAAEAIVQAITKDLDVSPRPFRDVVMAMARRRWAALPEDQRGPEGDIDVLEIGPREYKVLIPTKLDYVAFTFGKEDSHD